LYTNWRLEYAYELAPVFDWGHDLFAPEFYKSVENLQRPGRSCLGTRAEAGIPI